MVACSSLWEEWTGSTELCSLVTATEPKGTAWSCVRERSGWVLGKGSSPESDGQPWAAQGCGHRPKLMDFKEHLGNALRYRVWILGRLVWSQGLDLMILVGLCQLRIFCNSMMCLFHPLLQVCFLKIEFCARNCLVFHNKDPGVRTPCTASHLLDTGLVQSKSS